MAALDSTNVAILKHLSDGRIPYSVIARRVGVTENTVRARVARMVDDGLLQISGFVDPERIDGLEVLYVGVKLDTMNLGAKAEELSEVEGVVASAVVTGRYDIILTVVLSPSRSLLDFFTGEISSVENIASVETFVVYQGYKVRVPMMDGEGL